MISKCRRLRTGQVSQSLGTLYHYKLTSARFQTFFFHAAQEGNQAQACSGTTQAASSLLTVTPLVNSILNLEQALCECIFGVLVIQFYLSHVLSHDRLETHDSFPCIGHHAFSLAEARRPSDIARLLIGSRLVGHLCRHHRAPCPNNPTISSPL